MTQRGDQSQRYLQLYQQHAHAYPLLLAGHMHCTSRALFDVRFSGSTAAGLLQDPSITGGAYLLGSQQ